MFGWASSLYNWAIGGIDDLWNKVVSVITSVISWTTGLFNSVIADINAVYQWAWNLIQAVDRFASSIYTAITSWVTTLYDDIGSWVTGLWNQLYKYASGIYTWASTWIGRIYSDVTSWIRGLEAWVSTNIWAPLWNFISGAVRWIGNEGTWMLYLLTHPEALAQLLGSYLLAAWMGLSHKYAAPFARWVLRSMLSLSDEVAGIIEDFIAGLL